MTTLAYKYGLLDPLNWDQDCHQHLWLQNKLWNSLVEIERAHRERYRAIVGADTAVAEVQQQIDGIKLRQTALRKQRKRARSAVRAKVATTEIDRELKELSRQIQPLAELIKPLRKAAKESLREQIRALDNERFEAVKVARQEANWGGPEGRAIQLRIRALRAERELITTDQKRRIAEIDAEIGALNLQAATIKPGLWWGNANAVCASYETARNRAMKENAELKFHGFRGEGRFTAQIMNGATADEICNGHSGAHIDLTPQPVPDRHGQQRRGKLRPRLSITVYTDDSGERKRRRLLTFPLAYDRPLPADARIQQVVVTREKLGTRYRYAVVFTCRMPDAPVLVSASAKRCGINLGFRQHPDGLRVATIADEHGVRYVCLPHAWMGSMDAVEAIQQRRDELLNEIAAVMKARWPERPAELPEEIATRMQNLVNAPKFGAAKLAALVLRWRAHECWTQMRERLELWRKIDKYWLELEVNKRDKLGYHRREVYRCLARELAQSYGEIRIGAVNLRHMARIDNADGTENELVQRARRNRRRAALYTLQVEIAAQAAKAGAVVVSIAPPYTSVCHLCAGACAVTTDIMHVCERCSAVWDQDENAARVIFAAKRERSNAGESTGERSHDAASRG